MFHSHNITSSTSPCLTSFFTTFRIAHYDWLRKEVELFIICITVTSRSPSQGFTVLIAAHFHHFCVLKDF